MNLQEELKALKKRIAELEEQAKEEQEFPQKYDDYWYVSDDAEVLRQKCYNSEYDECRLSIGNIFRTKEEAEFAVEKLKVEKELQDFSRPFKEGENNYFIRFETLEKTIAIDSDDSFFKTHGAVYFETTNDVLLAIDTVGADRIKKYIFELED